MIDREKMKLRCGYAGVFLFLAVEKSFESSHCLVFTASVGDFSKVVEEHTKAFVFSELSLKWNGIRLKNKENYPCCGPRWEFSLDIFDFPPLFCL